MVVKALLNMYEKNSGQSVTFQKSGVFFSLNVRREGITWDLGSGQ